MKLPKSLAALIISLIFVATAAISCGKKGPLEQANGTQLQMSPVISMSVSV